MSTEESDTQILGIEQHNIVAAGFLISIVVIWEFLAQVGYEDLALIFPSLSKILGEVYWLFSSGEIYRPFFITLQEVIIGFALAVAIGVPLGTVLGANELLAEGVEPVIYYVSTIPKLLLYPLFIIALGLGIKSKIAMGFLSAIFPIIINTITGAANVKENLIKVPKIYGASRAEVFKSVYLPSMVTHIINGFRIGAGVAIIGVILGEHYATSTTGLGAIVLQFFTALNLARMYAVLVVIFVFSFVVNRGLLAIQRYLDRRGYGTGYERGEEEGFGF